MATLEEALGRGAGGARAACGRGRGRGHWARAGSATSSPNAAASAASWSSRGGGGRARAAHPPNPDAGDVPRPTSASPDRDDERLTRRSPGGCCCSTRVPDADCPSLRLPRRARPASAPLPRIETEEQAAPALGRRPPCGGGSHPAQPRSCSIEDSALERRGQRGAAGRVGRPGRRAPVRLCLSTSAPIRADWMPGSPSYRGCPGTARQRRRPGAARGSARGPIPS